MKMTDKTDRELLELAAKAAGISFFVDSRGRGMQMHANLMPAQWNPLAYDGDALRLLVGLKLDIQFFDGYAEIHVGGDGITSATVEPYAPDMQAATRRAIVRAAASIGEKMK